MLLNNSRKFGVRNFTLKYNTVISIQVSEGTIFGLLELLCLDHNPGLLTSWEGCQIYQIKIEDTQLHLNFA